MPNHRFPLDHAPLRADRMLMSLLVVVMLGLAACGSHGVPAAPTGTHRYSPLQVEWAPPEARSVVDTARSLIGLHYRYGGTTPQQGFDCSGLVHWVYLRHGVRLPRTTREQIRAGRDLTFEELRPGDLVFFRIGRGALHVGVYAGAGTFVHSPKSGGRVREDFIAGPYWPERFTAARRVL